MHIPKDLQDRFVWKEARANAEDDIVHYPNVTEIKYDTSCEDCGRHLTEMPAKSIRIVLQPYKRWQTQCKNCGLYQHPDTGEFSLTNQELRSVLSEANKKRDK